MATPTPRPRHAIQVRTELTPGRYLLICRPDGTHHAVRVEGDTAYGYGSCWGISHIFGRIERREETPPTGEVS